MEHTIKRGHLVTTSCATHGYHERVMDTYRGFGMLPETIEGTPVLDICHVGLGYFLGYAETEDQACKAIDQWCMLEWPLSMEHLLEDRERFVEPHLALLQTLLTDDILLGTQAHEVAFKLRMRRSVEADPDLNPFTIDVNMQDVDGITVIHVRVGKKDDTSNDN